MLVDAAKGRKPNTSRQKKDGTDGTATAVPKTHAHDTAERTERTDAPRASDKNRTPAGFGTDNIALLLDVDGTLLDIAPSPKEVTVPDNLRTTLQRLCRNLDGAIAFVSGRPLSDIDAIFAPLRLAAVGGHGAEIRLSGDSEPYRLRRAAFDPELKKEFSRIAKIGTGIIVEDKGYSVALHYRLAPKLAGRVMDAVDTIWTRAGKRSLEVLPGKAVIEIKPRGFTKGTGLRELMRHPPFRNRRPVFIGDDITDHAAFEALPEFHGIGYSVGGIMPGASFNFDGPEDVRKWLGQLSRGVHATLP